MKYLNMRSLAFLLTRPLRGATALAASDIAANQFLLTRPLRGATNMSGRRLQLLTFLLTRPLRGATGTASGNSTTTIISTHTPLAGRNISNHTVRI